MGRVLDQRTLLELPGPEEADVEADGSGHSLGIASNFQVEEFQFLASFCPSHDRHG